jgi:hypothetical protein
VILPPVSPHPEGFNLFLARTMIELALKNYDFAGTVNQENINMVD